MPPGEPFDVVLLDPPYSLADAAVTEVLATLVRRHWLGDEALVVVERSARGRPLTWPPGLEALRERRYGETTLWYGQPARRESPPGQPMPVEQTEEGAT
jgi:16S rRNA (guanine966-N2)-methyltransferase